MTVEKFWGRDHEEDIGWEGSVMFLKFSTRFIWLDISVM
jgi:hypothetical protein